MIPFIIGWAIDVDLDRFLFTEDQFACQFRLMIQLFRFKLPLLGVDGADHQKVLFYSSHEFVCSFVMLSGRAQ